MAKQRNAKSVGHVMKFARSNGPAPFGDGFFTEATPYNPHSPYSASKASSDHFVRAYHDTYGMDTVITNCSNNYGPNQYPEKLIPLFVKNIVEQRPLPVYGKGLNVRDWLSVQADGQARNQSRVCQQFGNRRQQ